MYLVAPTVSLFDLTGTWTNMRDYFLHFNGKGRIINLDPKNTTAEQFGEIQNKFIADAGGDKEKYDWPDHFFIYEHQKIGKLFYDEELASSSGMSFLLVALPDVTLKELKQAKDKLRQDRDVVSLKVLRVKELI